jgi:hypothetical protein
MLIHHKEEKINIATWKKVGLTLLIVSEVGLAPFLAEAVGEANDIVFQLITREPAPPIMNTIVGYSFSIPYVIAAMLSVGDLNKTIKRLMSPTTTIQAVNPYLKSIQGLLIGAGFLVGSGAAAAGVLDKWGKTPLLYIAAIYTMSGQMCVVVLQANKRIGQSAYAIEKFLKCQNKKELLKTIFHKPVAKASLNTLLNAFYWGAFYYYLGANVSHIFNFSNTTQKILSPTFSFLGAYMSFSTQGIDEIKSAYEKSTTTQLQVTEVQESQPNRLGTALTTLSFACRVLATASFSYSVINGDTESEETFNRTIGAIAVALMVPGAASALQYARYIHAQVNEAVVSLGGFFRCRRKGYPSGVSATEPLVLHTTHQGNYTSDNSRSLSG